MPDQIYAKESQNTNFSDTKGNILIKGARVHNLKNVDVALPRNKMIVITGVSGSGKSSLTIDTLYAEGQRRYVESLSSYARQFLIRMDKPDVDYIKGLCPAIAIEQRVATRTVRSTVGSMTEIYDYLRLLYARIGKTISPISGKEVKKDEVRDVVDTINEFADGTPVQILIPFTTYHNRKVLEELVILMQKGFTRAIYNNNMVKIEELVEDKEVKKNKVKAADVKVLIDRIVVNKKDPDFLSRTADSVNTAFAESEGICLIDVNGKELKFSNRFEADGILFEAPTAQFFSFNNPYGACKTCEGFGSVIGIDEDLVVPDKNLSIYEGAIACWRGDKMSEWNNDLIKNALKFDFPVHRPYADLTAEEKALLWSGNKYFSGLDEFFKFLESQTYKIQYRVMLSRYRGRTECPECHGTRLRKDVSYVKINKKAITDLVTMPISNLKDFFDGIVLSEFEKKVSKRIILEINTRIQFMCDVGLSYLSLNRLSSTLSGGETQRIQLTRTLGSNLTNSLYILDEPSVGLHPRDTNQLIKVLHQLRDLKNTVVVVEHDEEMMRHANHIIDMGPLAGVHGGEVIFSGDFDALLNDKDSLTGKYLNNIEKIEVPKHRRKWNKFAEVIGATENNLKNVSVRFPMNVLTVVTGVSGSGKTSLVKKILYPALQKALGAFGEKPGKFRDLKGNIKQIAQVEMVDQNPLGKTSRSNPVTYIKAYDEIRDLFANQQLSAIRAYKPRHFSFNVEGGRCETCKGEGEILVEMQFLADVHLVCEECHGKRFKDEVLEVTYKDKNIAEILNMTVDEALEFFAGEKTIHDKLKPLADVGLGYVQLGQSSSTLSGGEAQRVKLASFLGKGNINLPVFFIFDEPTTGLHFHDIKKLLKAFNALIENGHTVLVIEHNPDVIKSADHVIDLGPEGGEEGGYVLYAGTPDGLIDVKESYTGKFLKDKL
jgi:excinuclease ABC subunit A